MASAWVRSLHCKSRAFEDVYHPSPKNLIPNASCRKGVQSLKDVVETTKSKKPKPSRSPSQPPSSSTEKPATKHPRTTKSEAASSPWTRPRMSVSVSSRPLRANDLIFPALSELPEGHHSRSVVEIIFHTSWSPKAFVGRIEMIFKVQNASKTVARFEEYREMVKAKAASGSPADSSCWEENARCIADGNEVMRFHCMGPTSDCAKYDGCGGAWTFPGVKGSAICTFSGSGLAHENAGGGRGRRAMLVCRVIAGRVSKQLKIDSFLEGRVGLDSVSAENGELLVFDSRAVLPCFLIIYKL